MPRWGELDPDPDLVYLRGWRGRGGAVAANPLAPVNTAVPTISGTPSQGSTLTCSPGTWTNTPTGYAYQWLQDGVTIIGATASTYTLVSGNVGHMISCRVTATNANGSGQATAAGVGPITAAVWTPPPPMTSNSSPAGYTAAASSAFSASYAAWQAFDGIGPSYDHGWATSAAMPQWLQQGLPSSAVATGYSIASNQTNVKQAPTDWTLLGSNDGGSTLTVLDTRSGQVWVLGETKTFTIPTPGAYSLYRLNMTASGNGASNVSIAGLTFTG